MNFDDFIPDKPFKDYPELLQILKDRGFLINDDDINILKNAPYYDLINAYKNHFMIDDKLKKPMPLKYLNFFHKYDTDFQSILFKYSVSIEIKLKHKLAYVISKHLGVICSCLKIEEQNITSNSKTNQPNSTMCEGCKHTNICKSYLSLKNYIAPYSFNRREKLKQTIDAIKKTAHSSQLNPTKYYRENKNHIPPWILFKNISFNEAIDLYSFLPSKLKTELVEDWLPYDSPLEKRKELLKNALLIIRLFRNTIAHNNNFVSFKSSKKRIYLNLDYLPQIIKSTLLEADDPKELGTDDIFAMILCIILLCENNTLFFLSDMLTILPKNSNLFKIFKAPNSIMDDYLTLTHLPSNLQ